MSSSLFEVVYIDKFTDIAEAEIARAQIKARFKLTDKMMERLNSGKPTVVKKEVELAEAERFERAIKQAGGACWVQPASQHNKDFERRSEQRRQSAERRVRYRGSSILPDRRMSPARRSTD